MPCGAGDELVDCTRKTTLLLAQTLLGILSLFSLAETAFSRAATQTLGGPATWWPFRSLFLAPNAPVKSSGNCRRVKVMLSDVKVFNFIFQSG